MLVNTSIHKRLREYKSMNISFKEYLHERNDLDERNDLNERYINIIDNNAEKDKYKDIVWDLLQKSYAKIGGIKGSGFNNPDDMKSISFWKLIRKNGEIVAGKLYKDSNGRKSVASFTNQTKEGAIALADLVANEFDRSMGEVSADMLRFIIRSNGIQNVVKYAKTVDEASKILKKKLNTEHVDPAYPEKYPELAQFFYSREIGGHQHTKVLLGTPGQGIVDYL